MIHIIIYQYQNSRNFPTKKNLKSRIIGKGKMLNFKFKWSVYEFELY
jgi:hypothetical protein